MAYGLEEKSAARQLIVERQITYEDAAVELGISESQLKKWGKEGGWAAAKEEFEREYLEAGANVQKLFVEMSRKALDSKHSQDVIAVTNLMKAMPASRRGAKQIDKAALFIEFVESLIGYLKERDGESLRYLEPHIQGFAETMKAAAV